MIGEKDVLNFEDIISFYPKKILQNKNFKKCSLDEISKSVNGINNKYYFSEKLMPLKNKNELQELQLFQNLNNNYSNFLNYNRRYSLFNGIQYINYLIMQIYNI